MKWPDARAKFRSWTAPKARSRDRGRKSSASFFRLSSLPHRPRLFRWKCQEGSHEEYSSPNPDGPLEPTFHYSIRYSRPNTEPGYWSAPVPQTLQRAWPQIRIGQANTGHSFDCLGRGARRLSEHIPERFFLIRCDRTELCFEEQDLFVQRRR